MSGDQATMTIRLADGSESLPVTALHMKKMTDALRRTRLKNTREDVAVKDTAYAVTADELRQFVERYEELDAEKRNIADQMKEVMADAKGRGYDTRALRQIIALRRRKPDDIAEEQAVLDLYKSALGMD